VKWSAQRTVKDTSGFARQFAWMLVVVVSIALLGDLARAYMSEPWVSIIQLGCLWAWTIWLLRGRAWLLAVALIAVSATYLVVKILLMFVP
jgi:hypothetical protein